MSRKALPALFGLALLLSACGPQGTPTMAPVDVQNTAVAAAWTMVAATQQAIPTATPLPPTETPSPTPLPTFTPLALPTLPQTFPTATTAASSGGDTCIKPLNMGEAGPTAPIRIENVSEGDIYSISLNLWTPNAFGQCCALTYTNIKRNGTLTTKLPKGSWWAYAWINYRNGDTSNASGSFVIRPGDTELQRLLVGKEAISLKP